LCAKKRGKFGAKIFSRCTDIVIFVFGYFNLNMQHVGLHHHHIIIIFFFFLFFLSLRCKEIAKARF